MATGKYAQWREPEKLALVEGWAAECTDAELADKIGISRSTLALWVKNFSDVSDAVSRGRADARACATIAETLAKRATGYTVKVERAVKVRRVEYDQETGKRLREVEDIVMVAEDMHVPADVQAIKFFLTNRAPERWRNRVEMFGAVTGMTFEDWLQAQNDGGQEGGL